jgi:predicted DsbA family dithiol-disulfide isomerase
MRIEIWADVVCGWAYIGKRRLEKALASWDGEPVEVVWRPYQIDPSAPARAVPLTDALRDPMTDEALRACSPGLTPAENRVRVADLAAAEGLGPRWGAEWRASTLEAHRLIALAYERGGSALQDRVVEGVMKAHFIDFQDISHPTTLTMIANDTGLGNDIRFTSAADSSATVQPSHGTKPSNRTTQPSKAADLSEATGQWEVTRLSDSAEPSASTRLSEITGPSEATSLSQVKGLSQANGLSENTGLSGNAGKEPASEAADLVRELLLTGKAKGVKTSPTIVVGDRALAGAQSPETIRDFLMDASRHTPRRLPAEVVRLRHAESLLDQRDPLGALTLLRPLLDEHGKDRSVRMLAARAYYASAQLNRARATLETLVAEAPDDSYARHLLGRTLQRQGKHEEAASHLALAAVMTPDYATG